MAKPIYQANKKVTSIAQFEKLASKDTFFKFGNKTVHIAFLQSMQYRTIKNAIAKGRLFTVKKIKGNRK